MHIGKGYTFKEVILWTRRDIIVLIISSAIPITLYQVFKWKFLAIPWLPIALLGTAVAFVIGFKNNASYDRAWEARRIWGSITNLSRSWAVMVRDYITDHHTEKSYSTEELQKIHLELFNRHFAWLTALRFQLRENKTWEAIHLKHNKEYRNKFFRVEEHDENIDTKLKEYLSNQEFESIQSKNNKATQILSLQSSHLSKIFKNNLMDDYRHMELEKIIVELYNQQGASERIKGFPYPRQFASLNQWFIKFFVVLIPFGMISEFSKLGECYIWLSIPFSVLSGWIFTTMERIGETTENPFEGSANDIPITTISRNIEIDMLEILDITHNLKTKEAQNNILT